ncbi:DUF1456 family protein [Marivirga sp. S37H4]|uniref:DUF1456 family protein n=1 Tax=Marivirga aurantiaca TaxID=2802615 RepID=A0A934X033_9BACT|nr:DUF1456 family protein [Marivirga aurantiaca]MBK6266046.1 DUF1456 family protein [Marivirga aurantiaca]
MTNNEIIKRLRYILDYSDEQMIAVFEQADQRITRSLLSDWLKKEDDPEYKELSDMQLAIFLNGLINEKRGKREGDQPKPERHLDNNMILKKLKIAFDLKSEDMQHIFKLSNKSVSTQELGGFLRNPKQSQYRPCLDQYLRNFMMGLQIKYRGSGTDTTLSN